MAESSKNGKKDEPSPPDSSPTDQYFCHSCKLTVSSVQDFSCPRCGGGFLEKVEGQYDIDEDDDQQQPPQAGGFHPDVQDLFQNMLGGLLGGQMAGGINPSGPRAGGQGANRGPEEVTGFIQQLMERLAGPGVQFHMQIGGNGVPGMGLHGNPGDYAWGAGGLDQIVTQLLNSAESGPPPLSEQQINAIATVAVTEEQVEKKVQCTTCMEEFSVGEYVRQLSCAHIFHSDCIVPWLKRHNTCPICRTVLGEPGDKPQSNNTLLDEIDDLD